MTNKSFYIIPRIGGIAYLNIGKAACSSILLALSRMRLNSEFQPPREILEDGSEPIHGFSPIYAHMEHFLCRWLFDYPPLPKSIIRFSFVRNPYDRFYSFYKSKICNGQTPGKYYERFGIKRGCSFEECIHIITAIDPELLEHHATPQSILIRDGNKLLVDFIGKVEEFSYDWPVIQKITGLNLDLQHANVATGHKKTLYTEKLKEKIFFYYYDDFKLFGYNSELGHIDGSSIAIELKRQKNHHLSRLKLKELQIILKNSSDNVRHLAEKFNEDQNKFDIFYNNQDELFRELLLKVQFHLEAKIENQKNDQEINRDIFIKINSQLEKTKNEIICLQEKNENLIRFNKIQTESFEKQNESIKKQNESILKKSELAENTLKRFFLTEYESIKKQNESILKKSELAENTLKRFFLTEYAHSRKSIWMKLYRTLRYPKLNERKFLRDSGFVDPYYYYRIYPDVISGGMTAVDHYLRYGAQEGRNPSENFNTLKYLVEHPEIVRKGINPLVHFIIHRKA